MIGELLSMADHAKDDSSLIIKHIAKGIPQEIDESLVTLRRMLICNEGNNCIDSVNKTIDLLEKARNVYR